MINLYINKNGITYRALLVAFFLNVFSIYAEYSCGYFELNYPLTNMPYSMDLSELTDNCSTTGNMPDTCIVISKDIIFSGEIPDSIYAITGIMDLGEFDSLGWENLDTVPYTGYMESDTLYFNHIYAVKTTEEHYAALFYMFKYIGGNNRYGFKWAYQSDGTNNLSPNTNKKLCIKINILNNFKIKAIPYHGKLKIINIPSNQNVSFKVYNSAGQILEYINSDCKEGYCISTKKCNFSKS